MIRAAKLTAMRLPWIPILLCAVAADVNFWYFASTGENHADYLGIALFLGLAGYFLKRAMAERSPGRIVQILGCLAAAALMVAREADAFDRGYILPYVVLLLFLIVGSASSGASRTRTSVQGS